MKANWFWRRDGHVDLRRLAADQPPRQLLSHRARKRDAAAVAAERYQKILRGLVHVRIMIGGDRKPASILGNAPTSQSQPAGGAVPITPPTSGGVLDSLKKVDEQQGQPAPSGPQAPRSQ